MSENRGRIPSSVARQRILYQAAKSFLEVGYKNTRLTDLSSKANINLGSLINCYRHKEEILLDLVDSASRSALTDFFIDELRNGCVENREVRPGAVKAAVGPEGLVGTVAERFRAAAEAAARADVPLVVHTEKGYNGVRAVELACACGMSVHRVLICPLTGRRRTLRPTRPLPTPVRCWNTTPLAGSNITMTKPSAG